MFRTVENVKRNAKRGWTGFRILFFDTFLKEWVKSDTIIREGGWGLKCIFGGLGVSLKKVDLRMDVN